MNTKPIKVGVFVLPGGTMPEKGKDKKTGKVDKENVGFDVTARGIVSLKEWVPTDLPRDPYERSLIFDFKTLPTRPLTDSTPLAGLSVVIQPGKPQRVRFTIHAMLNFGCGFVLDMPKEMYAQIVDRGSTPQRGLTILNSCSPIEHTFGGEPIMAIHNWSSSFVELGPEDLTLGQLIFPGYANVELVPVKSIKDIPVKSRGNGNHGSTDKHRK